MAELQDVRYGWDFMAKLMGADLAGRSAYADYASNVLQNQQIVAQNLHIQEINAAIDELASSLQMDTVHIPLPPNSSSMNSAISLSLKSPR